MNTNPLYFWQKLNRMLKERGAIDKFMKNRDELNVNLITAIDKVKHNKDKVKRISEKLEEFDVSSGKTSQYLTHAKTEIPKMDIRLLCILTEQVYTQSAEADIEPSNYFTDLDIKKSKQFSGETERDEVVELPYVFYEVLNIDQENYFAKIHIQTIKSLMDAGIPWYNFDSQREAKYVNRNGKPEKEINVNRKSVKEIKDHLLNGTLVSTLLTFNCLVGTADEGDEIVYNAKKQELTITKGTLVEISDGMHRILGAIEALYEDPDLDFTFHLAIKNYNTRAAQEYVGQINTVNKMSNSRLKELKENRYSDTAVKIIQTQSEMKGKVSQTNRPTVEMGHLTSFALLSDTIDETFKITSKKEATGLAEYLGEFFDHLLGSFPDEFINNPKENKDKSIINSNSTFAGYIVLAKRIKDENINIGKLPQILEQINFSRDNAEWEKLGILENKRATNGSRKKIMKYFKELNIKETQTT